MIDSLMSSAHSAHLPPYLSPSLQGTKGICVTTVGLCRICGSTCAACMPCHQYGCSQLYPGRGCTVVNCLPTLQLQLPLCCYLPLWTLPVRITHSDCPLQVYFCFVTYVCAGLLRYLLRLRCSIYLLPVAILGIVPDQERTFACWLNVQAYGGYAFLCRLANALWEATGTWRA